MVPMLWGIVSNAFVDRGLQHSFSIGLSALASMACNQGHVKQAGEGKNLLTHLDIEDGEFFLEPWGIYMSPSTYVHSGGFLSYLVRCHHLR
jgi:hypothetical protein